LYQFIFATHGDVPHKEMASIKKKTLSSFMSNARV